MCPTCGLPLPGHGSLCARCNGGHGIFFRAFDLMRSYYPSLGLLLVMMLAGGGLAYMVGIAFYKWRSLRYHHAVWHGFVLLGSGLHFFSVLFYVIPWPGSSAA